MKANDIRALQQLSVAELTAKLTELRKVMADGKVQFAMRKLSNQSSLYHIRKDIARVQTVLHEKQLSEAVKSEEINQPINQVTF